MLIQVYGSDAVPKLLQILARHGRMLAEVSRLTDWEHGPPPKIIVSDFNFFFQSWVK